MECECDIEARRQGRMGMRVRIQRSNEHGGLPGTIWAWLTARVYGVRLVGRGRCSPRYI